MSSVAIRITATGEKSSTGIAQQRIMVRLLASMSEFFASGIASIRLAIRPAGGLLQALTGVASISLSTRLLKEASASKSGQVRTRLPLRSLVQSGVLLFVEGIAAISLPIRALLEATPSKSGETKISWNVMLVEAATKSVDAVSSITLPMRSFITQTIGMLANGVALIRLNLRSLSTVEKSSTGIARTAAVNRVLTEAEKSASGEAKTSLGLAGRVLQVLGFFVAGTARLSIALRSKASGEKSQSAVTRIAASIRSMISRGSGIRTNPVTDHEPTKIVTGHASLKIVKGDD